MQKKTIKKIKNAIPTRYNRIKTYIQILDKNITITNQRDKNNVAEIKKLAYELIIKLEKYYKINLALYIAIYFSFISFFFSDIIILSEISLLISKIVGIFGTTIFLIGLFFTNKIIELHYQDLNLLTAHLISIYSKYQKDTIEEILPADQNNYSSFIDFFRKKEEEKPKNKKWQWFSK